MFSRFLTFLLYLFFFEQKPHFTLTKHIKTTGHFTSLINDFSFFKLLGLHVFVKSDPKFIILVSFEELYLIELLIPMKNIDDELSFVQWPDIF
jgi:hypothetical protein